MSEIFGLVRRPNLAASLYVALFYVSMFCASAALGQPGVYQDSALTIPQVAVFDGDEPAYFTNVQLSNDGDGKLALVSAQASNLVTITSVQAMILESFPVQINLLVSGYKSVPCVELEPVAVSRKDTQFTVLIAETTLGPAESCIALIDPFETNVSLDVLELAAGTYTVSVNGETTSFTLDIDNTAAN